MSNTTSPEEEVLSDYSRLDQQINWYDRKSIDSQRYYKRIKLLEIIFAAAIPALASFSAVITGTLGAAIVVLEGLQQYQQWQHNWITYRSTCEALRHEKYAYMGSAGVYDGKSATEAKKILVERVEALISTEHSKWISRQEYGKPKTSTERNS